jgi:hypothetical protein
MAAPVDLPWYVSPLTPPKDRLTFGVELEVSAAYLVAGEKDRDPDDPRSVYHISTGDKSLTLWQNNRNHIAETLRSNGIAAEVVPEPGDNSYTRQNPRAWVIASDLAVFEKPPDDGEGWYNYSPVELISPVFYYTQEALDEVKFVMTLMSNTYRCGTTTGLHVHVGNSTKGFPPSVIQKLLGTIWTFKEHLELIHPKVRWDYGMCPSMRRGSTLIGTDEYLKKPEQRTKLGGFEWLMAPENSDMTELYEATKPNADLYPESIRSGINIKCLSDEKDAKNTVEFQTACYDFRSGGSGALDQGLCRTSRVCGHGVRCSAQRIFEGSF